MKHKIIIEQALNGWIIRLANTHHKPMVVTDIAKAQQEILKFLKDPEAVISKYYENKTDKKAPEGSFAGHKVSIGKDNIV